MARLSNIPLIFAPSAKGQKPVKHLHPVRKSFGVQGGCCSDKYIYQLMCGKVFSAIRVIDPKSWKTVKVADRLRVAHGNDMCWNSRTNEIIVVHNFPELRTVSVFDADTLKLKYKKKLDIGAYAIDYDPKRNVYYVCETGGRRFARMSADFEIEEMFSLDVRGHVRQGMAFHNGRLYMVLYRENVIKVFDTEGNYIETFPLPVSKGEPENLVIFDNTFYIAYNKKKYRGGIIYRLDGIK